MKKQFKFNLNLTTWHHEYDWKQELNHAIKQAYKLILKFDSWIQLKLEFVILVDNLVVWFEFKSEFELDLNIDMHLNICQIKPVLFISLIRKLGYELFIVLIIDIEKILKLKKYINSVKKILKKYYEFLDIFSQKKADKLLKHHSYNYKIKLKFEKQLLFKFIYKISLNKLKYLQKYLRLKFLSKLASY